MAKAAQDDEKIQIPDGYVLSVLNKSSRDSFHFFNTESHLTIADFGEQEYLANGFEVIDDALKEDGWRSVIWVLQKAAVDYWTADTVRMATLLRRFRQIQEARAALGGTLKPRQRLFPAGMVLLSTLMAPDPELTWGQITDHVCVEDTGPSARALIALLKDLGISAAALEPGGRIMIQVQRPDNSIIFVLPSRKDSPDAAKSGLEQVYAKIGPLWQPEGSPKDQPRMGRDETGCIEKVMKTALPLGKKLFGGPKPDERYALLSSQMNDLAARDIPRLIEVFKRAALGIRMSEDPPKEGEQRKIASVYDFEGQLYLLLSADTPLYEMRYPRDFNSLVDGAGAFNIVLGNPEIAGIHINNALKESRTLITRESIVSAMESG